MGLLVDKSVSRSQSLLQLASCRTNVSNNRLRQGVHDTARLVISQVFIGIGGSFSVVASQVASQASVPHQDVALAISLLSLWTQIGVSIGSAIASGVWQNRMPGNLRMFLPASVDDATVALYFQGTSAKPDITRSSLYACQNLALPLRYHSDQGSAARVARASRSYHRLRVRSPIETYHSLPASTDHRPPRQSHRRTCYPLFAGALALSFIPLVAACFQQNYLLGNGEYSQPPSSSLLSSSLAKPPSNPIAAQNMYDGMDVQGEPTGEHLPENQAPKSKLQKLLSFWDQ